MKKILISIFLIVTTLVISIFGSCALFDKIYDAFDDVLNESQVESEKESANIDNESNKESDSVALNPLADKLVLVYGGVDYGAQKGLKLVKGNSYSLKLEVRTADGDVLEDCNNFKITKIVMQGRFYVLEEQIENGAVVESFEFVANSEEGTIDGKKMSWMDVSNFVSSNISNGYLTIKAIKSEKDFFVSEDGRPYRLKYKSEYYDPRGGGVAENVSWYVYVEEVFSGKGQILYLDY